jgi:hypothetical protein
VLYFNVFFLPSFDYQLTRVWSPSKRGRPGNLRDSLARICSLSGISAKHLHDLIQSWIMSRTKSSQAMMYSRGVLRQHIPAYIESLTRRTQRLKVQEVVTLSTTARTHFPSMPLNFLSTSRILEKPAIAVTKFSAKRSQNKWQHKFFRNAVQGFHFEISDSK